MRPAEKLSTEDLAGQRLVVGFDGTEMNDDLRFLLEELRVGGIILFSRNIVSPGQVARLCRDVQAHAARCGLPPLLVAVDQEGGAVARLRPPHFTAFPGSPGLPNEAAAERFARITARELRSVGFNMDMAPVVDVAPADGESVMRERVFGTDPEVVGRMGKAVIRGLQRRGVMAVAKHFPGIGRTVLDSHVDRPFFGEPAEGIRRFDLPPFAEAIRAGVAGIMLSHIVYESLDPRWPASLSPAVARDLLRGEMGYRGVVMTDDLDMGAVARHHAIETVVVQVLEADVDIALICHKGPDIEAAYRELAGRIGSDPAVRGRCVRSARRVLRCKTRFGAGLS